MRKRITALIISAAFILSGCGAAPGDGMGSDTQRGVTTWKKK